MLQSHTGEIIALGTAMCWTVSSLSFQKATGRAGALSVNIIRMLIALFIYAIVSKIINGFYLPLNAPAKVWTWMSISGLVGFIFGDYFLFKSFEFISARISMLIMSLTPPVAAFISWLVLGETMSVKSLTAMLITITGIVLVVVERSSKNDTDNYRSRKMNIKYSPKGILYAFIGAVGQAGGLVISKYGMTGYSVFGATQIRIIAASIGFALLVIGINKFRFLYTSLQNGKTMLFITIGALFGPFFGVYLSLLSVKFTSVGIASTIMAIVPILIIPPAIVFLREKVSWTEVAGSVIAVSGVAIFFL